MARKLFNIFLLGTLIIIADVGLTSCSSGRHCVAVAGTGNYKPDVRRKTEKGISSRKMEKAINKAKAKKAGPIKKRKLSFD